MLSEVHFIIAADAGVKAKVESTAAAIIILISDLAWERNQRIAGDQDMHSPADTFPQDDIFFVLRRNAKRGAGRAPPLRRDQTQTTILPFAAFGDQAARMIPAVN